MSDGRFRRPIAIRQPGMFLSQPGSDTLASYHCAPITVSIESAIRSRDWSEKLMPSVPIEMPSLTPIVLKRMPTMPAAATPSFTFSASASRCMLQGLPSYHTLAMPTCGFCMSASDMPVAYSIACDAPCDFCCVMRELNLLSGAMAPDSTSRGGIQYRQPDHASSRNPHELGPRLAARHAARARTGPSGGGVHARHR